MATPEVFSAALENQSYRPYSVIASAGGYTQTADAGQRFGVYMPSRPPSEYDYGKAGKFTDRYPGAVVVFESSSFNTSPDSHVKTSADDITTSSDYRYNLLDAGFPVIVVQLTVASGDTELNLYGNGMYHAPGGQDRRWEEHERPNQQKDAIMAFQYIKTHRGRLEQALKDAGYDHAWDDNYCVAGTSSAGCAASELLFKPSHAFALGSDHEFTADTVPNCGIVMATNVAMPWAFLTSVTFFENLPQAETGGTADTAAATLAAAPDRYRAELGAWINMAGMRNKTIPHVYCWSDAAVAQVTAMQSGFQKNWGEPFDDTGTLGTLWQATSHLIATFLALKSAYPDRIHLTAGDDLLTFDYYGLHALEGGRLDEVVNDAFSATPTDAKDAESVVRFVKEHIRDTPWDRDPESLADGIYRRGQVETVGRYCIPPNPLRKGLRIFNVGRDTSVGPASDEALFVGPSSRAMVAEIPLGESISLEPATGPHWFKSGTAGTTDYAKFGAVERF